MRGWQIAVLAAVAVVGLVLASIPLGAGPARGTAPADSSGVPRAIMCPMESADGRPIRAPPVIRCSPDPWTCSSRGDVVCPVDDEVEAAGTA